MLQANTENEMSIFFTNLQCKAVGLHHMHLDSLGPHHKDTINGLKVQVKMQKLWVEPGLKYIFPHQGTGRAQMLGMGCLKIKGTMPNLNTLIY